MFGRTLSKDKKEKGTINITNMSMTSYGGIIAEERTELLSERSASQSVAIR